QEAGFIQYEISNYAQPGFESQHNSSYWDGTPYLGLGPGAHSFDGQRKRCWNEANLLDYLDGQRHEEEELLTDEDIFNERIMLGLRTRRGVKLEDVRQQLDFNLVQKFVSKGWLTLSPTHFRLTPAGLAMGDEVMRTLFI
ncbi:MAG: coproporphyrinogen III oxidase, partial [Bacteroidales bacterium]|nr:coproporphyrinogen III oxidase [Bacteroidales bacterium]